MTRLVKGHIFENFKFSSPFRMILSGSSGSGKTFFAGKLLKSDLFQDEITNIFYYYPCYLKEAPVDWHQKMNVPVVYNVGLPTKTELSDLPKGSCVVIDDSFDDAIKSSAIDHLFRVISGKMKISVMIMTQNNFSKGKYGREIRNSCNFSVLFRNCCDTTINGNITRMAGLNRAYNAAMDDQIGSQYPYVLLDQSQKGQMTPFRVFTNIFDRYPVTWSVNGMKAFVVAAQDFKLFFKVIEKGQEFTALENESTQPSQKNNKPRNSKSQSTNNKSKNRKNGPSKTYKTKEIRKTSDSSSTESEFSDQGTKRKFDSYWDTSSSDDSESRKRLRRLVYED